MTQAFADTGYWIALLNPRDELHDRAVAAVEDPSSTQLLTTEMVLVEFLNSFSDRGSRLRLAAARAVNSLRNDPNVTIAAQTSSQFEQALRRYRERSDKDWSLTDCASFLIMEAAGITAALTHDRHFGQAGFQVLL